MFSSIIISISSLINKNTKKPYPVETLTTLVRNLPELLRSDPRHADRLFFDLLRATQMGNVILVSPPTKSRETRLCLSEASQLGLEVKYTYRVTQVADLGEGRQLVRLRNASGPNFVAWSGAWNPKDTRWSSVPEEARRQLQEASREQQSNGAGGGGFWMAYGDFLKYFKVE